MKKSYLITGATGYLGSHIAEFFIKKKYNVILFDKKKSKIFIKNKVILGDINDFDKLKKVTKNVDTIFHFAATADLNEANKKPFATIENNLNSTLKLLKVSIKNKVKKIIFASSVYAISEQGGIYSTTKLASEMIIERICRQHNIKFIILRFGTVYGGRANKFNTVFNYIKAAKTKKKIFRETKGNEVRSYIHIEDLVKIVFELTKNKYINNHYNIMGNKKFLVKDLFQIIKQKISGLKIIYSKSDKKKYNYKINPFSYQLRKGTNIKLKKYISLETGIENLINK